MPLPTAKELRLKIHEVLARYGYRECSDNEAGDYHLSCGHRYEDDIEIPGTWWCCEIRRCFNIINVVAFDIDSNVISQSFQADKSKIETIEDIVLRIITWLSTIPGCEHLHCVVEPS